MCQLKIFRYKYPLSRFWELFRPTVPTFSFWLATAAFSFFAYQSLIPPSLEGIMNWTAGVLSAVFLVFGIACMLVIFYLFITWRFGIRITKRKTNEEEIADTKNEIAKLTEKLLDLEKELGKSESKNEE